MYKNVSTERFDINIKYCHNVVENRKKDYGELAESRLRHFVKRSEPLNLNQVMLAEGMIMATKSRFMCIRI